jgi:CubicO group peptidase (beta-lactamase class C family)
MLPLSERPKVSRRRRERFWKASSLWLRVVSGAALRLLSSVRCVATRLLAFRDQQARGVCVLLSTPFRVVWSDAVRIRRTLHLSLTHDNIRVESRTMQVNRRRLLSLAAAAAMGPIASRLASAGDSGAQTAPRAQYVFPGSQWEAADPYELGWSVDRLAEAYQFFASLPPASLVVVDRGRIVACWGDSARRVKLSSIRKSFLSALYGKPVAEGVIDLNATLASLGVDDDPPLTANERQATVQMLLEARSGIYHGYAGGTPYMRSQMPQRGSHAPGSFWSYNNWDFNALGGIYESKTKKTIGKAFAAEIATPLQMQDFRPEDMYYLPSPENADDFAKSNYPAYHFRLTARDMARFGYLYLRKGNWGGEQVIPADWLEDSTSSYSDTTGFGEGFGYGYLWWVNGYGLSTAAISARGALGKYIVVIPERDLVVAFANHVEFPDGPQSSADIKKLPDVPAPAMSKLLALLLAAQRS